MKEKQINFEDWIFLSLMKTRYHSDVEQKSEREVVLEDEWQNMKKEFKCLKVIENK